jgi:peptide/nickel transport system substrate-binding protein
MPRRPVRRAKTGLALRAVAVAVAVACASCAAPPLEPTAEVLIRAPFGGEPQTLALLNTSDLYSNTLGLLVSDALVRYDDHGRLVPRVAETWTVSDDHKTVTFRLREGVVWHDGTPVTADDVRFSFEKIRDPVNGDRAMPAAFERVDVEVPNRRTVIARYDEPNADFLASWTFPLVPAHLAGADADLRTGAFASAPVGCGPFRFVSHEPGNEVVLEAFPDHWAGRPGVDRLVFKVLRDQRTALQALLSGNLELMAVPSGLFREALDSGRAGDLQSTVYTRASSWYLAFNLDRPALADARVRRAIVHLLDRREFVDRALDGLAVVGVTTWHPDSPWTDRSIEPIPYDPAAAAALLAEAGWADTDGDGRLDREGRPLAIRLLHARASQAIVDRFAAWFQQSLEDAGIGVEIRALEFQTFREERDKGGFDVVSGSFGLDPIADQTELYHSSSVEHGFNFFRWRDDETDRLLEEGLRTFDPDRRFAIYAALQRRIREQAPLVSLFHLETPLLYRKEIRGVVPGPLGVYRTVPGPAGWSWDPTVAPEP